MILPLGLGKRYFKFPILTILLVSLNVIIHVGRKSILPGSADFNFITGLSLPSVYPAAVRSFEEYCSKEFKMVPEECRATFDEILELAKSKDRQKLTKLNPRKSTLFFRFIDEHLRKAIPGWPEPARVILKEHYASNYQFSRVNPTLINALISEFQHGGFSHLIGNMLFLILTGVWVEQRMGRLLMLALYLLGGTLGFYLSSVIELNPVVPLVGASANVATLMGLFTYFFGKYRGRFKFWYLFPAPITVTFHTPTAYILLPIYFFADLIGSFDGGGGIAHAAHLGGWVFGFLTAHLYQKKYPVQLPFIHIKEREWTQELQNISDDHERMHRAQYLLERNSENRWARESVVKIALKELKDFALLRQELAPLISVLVREGKIVRAVHFLEVIPLNLTTASLIPKLNPAACRKIFFEALNHGFTKAALRAYALYKSQGSKMRISLMQEDLLRHVGNDQRRQEWIEAFFEQDPKSYGDLHKLLAQRKEELGPPYLNALKDNPGDEDAIPGRFSYRFIALFIDAAVCAGAGSFLFKTLEPLATLVIPHAESFMGLIVNPFLNILVLYLLIWWPMRKTGQSLGKKALHLKVIESRAPDQSTKLRWSTILLREVLGKFLSSVFLGLGYLFALGPKGLSLHDRLAGTRVVQSD